MEEGTVSASVLFVCLVLTALAQDDSEYCLFIVHDHVPLSLSLSLSLLNMGEKREIERNLLHSCKVKLILQC